MICVATPVTRDDLEEWMQYARYGKDGPEVSRLGFGAMRLPPTKGGGWGTVHFRKSVAIIRQALEAGVNFIDSHHNYHGGLSEVAIGRALRGWPGRVVVQTKTPFYKREPLDWFKRRLDEALEKTGVGVIDYLLFHSMNMDMWKRRGRQFIRFTDWAMNRGLIRHRGFSSHDRPENVRQFIDTGEFAAMLLSFHWQNPEMTETIAHAAERGMGVSIMNPVCGGMLAVNTPGILRLLPGAKTGAEVALRYVLSTPGVTLALSGMNAPEQVEENVRTASRRVPMTARQREEMLRRVDAATRKAKHLCTGCGYCMPCPNSVDIPRNLLLLNRVRFFGLIAFAKEQFRRLRKRHEKDHSALACVRCGRCLPKCPSKVAIIELLHETAEMLAGK